jgi:hypothetical protein
VNLTVPRARNSLRECARRLEETAVALEDAGYVAIRDELRTEASHLMEINEALHRLSPTRTEPLAV